MTDLPERPRYSISAAAEACGVSRRTLARRLDAGGLPGAERDSTGHWLIPVEALLAAGLHPHATKPSPEPAPPPPPDEAERLRAENVALRIRAEVAEAVSAERAQALEDLRVSLRIAERMLTAGPTVPTPSDSEEPTPPVPAPTPVPEAATRVAGGRLAQLWKNRRS